MKQKSEQTQKFLYALPAALIVLLALAMAALCAVALCYAVAIQIAWDSVMAFFILFGLSFIGAGLCAISVAGFFTYMRRVWYDRWPQAPGARFFVRADEGVKPVGGNTADEKSGDEAENDAESGQTTLKNAKNKSSSVIFKPKFLSPLSCNKAHPNEPAPTRKALLILLKPRKSSSISTKLSTS